MVRHRRTTFPCVELTWIKPFLVLLGPPKTEAQLKKEAKKREKLEKFQQKKDMEAKKKMQPVTEVRIFNHNTTASIA